MWLLCTCATARAICTCILDGAVLVKHLARQLWVLGNQHDEGGSTKRVQGLKRLSLHIGLE